MMRQLSILFSALVLALIGWAGLQPRTAAAAACTPDWTVTVTATDSQSSATTADVAFGVATGATTNDDGVGCDVQAPPAPPSSVYSVLESANSVDLLTDIRPNNAANEWKMKVSLSAASHYPLVVSWNTASLTGSGSYLLVNDPNFANFRDSREPAVVDMRSASSATFYAFNSPLASITSRTFYIIYTPLKISKTVDDTTVNPGQTLNYTVVLSNTGSADLTGITIADSVPTGLTFVNGSASLAGQSAGTTGNAPNLATGVTVPANSQVTLTYQMSVSATTLGTIITNTASATSTGISTGVTAQATVMTVDSTPPVLSLPSNITVEATSASGAAVTYSVTATDAVDANPTVACSPASGSTFAIGTTTVNCTATDAANNQSSGSFTITVRDSTAPALSLPSSMTVEATSASGATVTYSVTATDAVDSNPTVACSPASGGTFAIGTTTVNCTATDATNNQSSGSFTITVRDSTAPALSVPSTINLTTSNANGTTATFTVTATDAVTGSPTIVCSPTSGSTFAVGSTTVNCTATDGANNQASGSFLVVVVYQLSVTPSAGWNLMAIPLVVDNMSLSSMFPEATNAYAYNGSTYVTTDTLRAGVGYWINFPASKAYTITGTPFSGVSKVSVHAGWNMIGSYHDAATSFFVQGPNAIESNFFDYNNNRYRTRTQLDPWAGYWVKVTNAGELFYNGSQGGGRMALPKQARFSQAACPTSLSLPLTASAGDWSQAMTLGVASTATDGIDAGCGEAVLPPLSPSGLDARLVLPDGTRSWVDYRAVGGSWALELGDIDGPMVLNWNSAELNNHSLTLHIFNAGKLTSIDMSQSNSADIPNDSAVSISVSGSPTAVKLGAVGVLDRPNTLLLLTLLAALSAVTIRVIVVNRSDKTV